MEKIGGSKLYKMNKTKPISSAGMHELHEEKRQNEARIQQNETFKD